MEKSSKQNKTALESRIQKKTSRSVSGYRENPERAFSVSRSAHCPYSSWFSLRLANWSLGLGGLRRVSHEQPPGRVPTGLSGRPSCLRGFLLTSASSALPGLLLVLPAPLYPVRVPRVLRFSLQLRQHADVLVLPHPSWPSCRRKLQRHFSRDSVSAWWAEPALPR